MCPARGRRQAIIAVFSGSCCNESGMETQRAGDNKHDTATDGRWLALRRSGEEAISDTGKRLTKRRLVVMSICQTIESFGFGLKTMMDLYSKLERHVKYPLA